MHAEPQSVRSRVGHLPRMLMVVVTCAIAVFPFFWMLRTSIASKDSVFFDGISVLPDRFDFSNYSKSWHDAQLGSAMLNGLVVAGIILACQLLTCVPAAYAFAKLRFRGANAVFGLVLASLLIPVQATALPTYIGVSVLGLANTRTALIVPFLTSGFGIFLIRQHMLTIPDALMEAARADGLGPIRTLMKVVLPLSRPAIATFSVFSIWVHWNDYLWPLLVARSPQLRTPPLALAVFQDAERGINYSALAAGAVIVTLPIVVLFTVAQKRFVQGIAGGEITG